MIAHAGIYSLVGRYCRVNLPGKRFCSDGGDGGTFTYIIFITFCLVEALHTD